MIKLRVIILLCMWQVWRGRKEETASKIWFDGPTMLRQMMSKKIRCRLLCDEGSE